MPSKKKQSRLLSGNSVLEYRGESWCRGRLPREVEPWPKKNGLLIGPDNDQDDALKRSIHRYLKKRLWVWPTKTAYFFCDQHADADAFFLSLVASGGIEKTEDGDDDFTLTSEGQKAVFIIGGDCFDKGPDNLRLLDVLWRLRNKGADLRILCGNHDLRTYLAMIHAEDKDPKYDHLFVRMGKKGVPLLKEIVDRYVVPAQVTPSIDEETIRERLFPSAEWKSSFAREASGLIPEEKIEKEIIRIQEKCLEFEERLQSFGLTLPLVYSAIQEFKRLFIHPKGQYHWFFNTMDLVYRDGSYLFAHAGIDDGVAKMLLEHGPDEINRSFHRTLKEDPFTLYHGRLGNVFRTKYRSFDYPLTSEGTGALKDAGVHAIVHGHRNILHGHRLVIREGMLNFECDVSVDRNTRKVEGLEGEGAGVVIFRPEGQVLGISTDYPFIKCFTPRLITRFDS